METKREGRSFKKIGGSKDSSERKRGTNKQ